MLSKLLSANASGYLALEIQLAVLTLSNPYHTIETLCSTYSFLIELTTARANGDALSVV